MNDEDYILPGDCKIQIIDDKTGKTTDLTYYAQSPKIIFRKKKTLKIKIKKLIDAMFLKLGYEKNHHLKWNLKWEVN